MAVWTQGRWVMQCPASLGAERPWVAQGWGFLGHRRLVSGPRAPFFTGTVFPSTLRICPGCPCRPRRRGPAPRSP